MEIGSVCAYNVRVPFRSVPQSSKRVIRPVTDAAARHSFLRGMTHGAPALIPIHRVTPLSGTVVRFMVSV